MKGVVLAFAVFTTLGSPLSHSADRVSATDPRPWYSENALYEYQYDLQFLDGPKGFEGNADASLECRAAYEKIYLNDTLDIRVFLGYANTEADPGVEASDVVSDGYFRAKFIEILTQPCVKNVFDCGFRVETDDQKEFAMLTKDIEGPDHRSRHVRLSLQSSSVSESDRDNRHRFKKEQKEQTRRISQSFFRALSEANVVLYVGHSRVGTGPGFKPLSVYSFSGIRQWLFKPSLHSMLRALEKADVPPAIVGLFGCKSDRYYRMKLQKAAPESGIVVTTDRLNALEEAHASMLGTINSVLGLSCESDFQHSLHQAKVDRFF